MKIEFKYNCKYVFTNLSVDVTHTDVLCTADISNSMQVSSGPVLTHLASQQHIVIYKYVYTHIIRIYIYVYDLKELRYGGLINRMKYIYIYIIPRPQSKFADIIIFVR